MAEEAQDRFVRVEPDDPTRCSGVGRTSGDQCPFRRVKLPNHTDEFPSYAKGCPLHMGDARAADMKRRAKKLYDIERYRAKVDRLSDSEAGAYLDEELGVLRMTLETCLNRYGEVELVTQSGQISQLISSIERVLTTNKKLKSQMGELLDRAAISKLCDALVVVISENVDPSKLDKVSGQVAQAVVDAVSAKFKEEK